MSDDLGLGRISPEKHNRPAPRSRQIIDAAHEALKRASAPICYLHRTENDGPFALVIEHEHWQKIMATIPEGEAITELVMNHGHVEGDDGY